MNTTEKNEILSNLRTHLSDIITMFERTKEENTFLFNENQKLLKINKQKDEEIKKIKEKLETYKLSNAFIIASEGTNIAEKKHDSKIKINQIVKEIDKCISLLNK